MPRRSGVPSDRQRRSGGCSSPTTCSRSRSPRSSSSWPPSVAWCSARTPGHSMMRAQKRPMHGPSITWYIALAVVLFVTGGLGVLIRRSPLIILLSVEIMLNGANLALIAFARRIGSEDGQIFAVAVMAVAASEVVVGLGLIVAMGRRNLELAVDKFRTLPR